MADRGNQILSPCSRACRGLTFIELMFATVILGLGMIIIASVFPVAIGEQRATIDAAASGQVERGAARSLDALVSVRAPATAWLPTTTGMEVDTLTDPPTLWNRIRGDQIDAADPHYGWTAVYQRTPPAAAPTDAPSRAVFYVFTLISRNTATFTQVDSDFAPKEITFDYDITPGNDPDLITIKSVLPAADADAVCEGAFIARSGSTDLAVPLASQSPVIKLGNLVGPNQYEVAPGFEIFGTVDLTGANGWLVGRGRVNGVYDGPPLVQSCRPIEVAIPYPG
jgi:type II secretory pathway pseudopilin PulG